jgi:hypothetical protein
MTKAPLHNNRSHLLRLLIGGGLVLIASLLLFLLPSGGTGYAAPPVDPIAKHRTPTATATPTPGGVRPLSEPTRTDDPFVGYESVPAFATFWVDLCNDTVVGPGGEAWVLNASFFAIGEPGFFNSVTLFVQRCVGDFQPWGGIGSLTAPGVFNLLPPAGIFLPIATVEAPAVHALLLPPGAFRVLPTPVAIDRAPVLVPIFSTPFAPLLPTIIAPERFDLLPTTSVTLRTPAGEEVVLPLARSDRPDLWSYNFPISAPSGTYELVLASDGSSQTRQISVRGAARIYATDRSGNLQDNFVSPGDAVLTFADFRSGEKVSVVLYRLVGTPDVNNFSSDPLAEVGRWTFTPGDQPSRERLSQRLSASVGPAYGTFMLLACYADECNQLPRIAVNTRRVIWPEMVLGSVYIEPDASVLTLPNSFETIRFAPGALDDLVELTLSDSSPAGYLITASAGQRMRIQLDTPNVQVYVLDPFGELLLPEGQGVAVWEFALQQSGQHRLIVYGKEDGHMTVTIPPGSAAPAPSSSSLHDTLLEKMAAADTGNDFPNRANALVEHLLAHLSDFDQTGIGSAAVIDGLGRADVGDRLNGIVHKVWGDWSRDSSNPLNDNPAGLSPFRQLVVRMIQGSIGILSAQEQRAILSWLTRNENPSVWQDNPNGVIGAINREIFP